MSKVASSNSDLTLNADGSGNDIKFQSNGTEVGSINSSGTMTATAFAGDGSSLTGVSGGGKVLQVVNTIVTAESFSTTSTSDTEITGLNASITPSATTSKIRITVMITFGGNSGNTLGFGLIRDSTQIGSSSNASGSQRNAMVAEYTYDSGYSHTITYQYLDSPSTTSATEYKATVSNQSGYGFNLNKPPTSSTDDYVVKGVSNIILEEIGA